MVLTNCANFVAFSEKLNFSYSTPLKIKLSLENFISRHCSIKQSLKRIYFRINYVNLHWHLTSVSYNAILKTSCEVKLQDFYGNLAQK